MNISEKILLEIQDWVQTNEIYPNCKYKQDIDTKSNHYDFLHELCRITKPNTILELGTHLGVSALYMKIGNPNAKIYTIDNNLINSGYIGTYIKNLPNVKFILGDCKNPDVVNQIPNDIDLIFIDEEKEPETLQKNLDLYYPKLKIGGCILFDDVLGVAFYPQAYQWWLNLKGYNKISLPMVHIGYALGAIIK